MENIKLIKGDSFEILQNIPSGSIDLVIADAPYEIATTGGGGSVNTIKKLDASLKDLKKNQDITEGYDIDAFADIVDRLQGGNINAYFWCNKAQIPDYFRAYVDRLGCKFDILTWHKCLHSSTDIVAREQNGTIKRMQLKDVFRKRQDLEVYDGSQWTKIIDILPKSNVEEYIKIKLRDGNNIKCTKEHRFSIGGKLLEAKDLIVGQVLDSCTIPTNDLQCEGITSTMQWLLGHYVAEGNKLCKRENSIISISTNKQNEFVLQQITKVCKEYGATFSVYDDYGSDNSRRIHIRSSIIVAIVDNYIVGDTSYNKHFTKKLFSNSKEFIRNVLQGYLDGDGHYDVDNNRHRLGFTYKNRDLAKDLCLMCNLVKYKIHLTKGEATYNDKKFSCWKGEIRMHWDEKRSKSQYEIIGISIEKNHGNIFYDLCLDNHNHLFALYDGVLTHNCNALPTYSNKYLSDTEYCLYFHKGKGKTSPQSYDDAKTYWFEPINHKDKKLYGHPTIKPLHMIERLIRNSSKEDDTVLDPFMGSGTTGVACYNLNRKFIGVEIDDNYYNIAKSRLDEAKATQTLF